MATVEQLINAKNNGLAVIFRRWSNESPLHFRRVLEITPSVDSRGRRGYDVTVEAKNGCIAHVRADQLQIEEVNE